MRKNMLLGWGIVLIGVFLCTTVSSADELSRIQQAIREQGLEWTAGETPLMNLSPAERKLRLGLRPAGPAAAGVTLAPESLQAIQLPSKLDWRSNGGDYVTSVKDQGSCGSCWAFATAAALESHVLITNHLPDKDLDLSEQVMVSCCLECSEWLGGCQGGWLHISSEFARTKGLPLESCYKYSGSDGSCSRACGNWQGSAYKMADWNWITPPERPSNVQALKNALYQYGPILVAMGVYDDFFSYKNGIYSRGFGYFAGYHAVLIVGYDDSAGIFIVKNSWGTSWGWMGYFNIAYSMVTDCKGDPSDPNNTNPGVCLGFEAIAYSNTPFEGKVTHVNAANYSGLELAGDSIASGFGKALATTTEAASTIPLPTVLGGTTVKVTDIKKVSRMAPLFFVSPGQVNYQIPPGTAPGMAEVAVTSGNGTVSSGTPQIAARVNSDYDVLGPAAAPGLFSQNATGQGVAAANVLRVKADGSQSYEPAASYDSTSGKWVPVPIDLGPATDQVFLILYGTGIRYVTKTSAAKATIGGVSSEVTFAGAQGGFVGLDQVNIKLPQTLIGKGEVDVALTTDSKPANIVKISIR
jgi:uncharacterized protein (TIGR03437 family)